MLSNNIVNALRCNSDVAFVNSVISSQHGSWIEYNQNRVTSIQKKTAMNEQAKCKSISLDSGESETKSNCWTEGLSDWARKIGRGIVQDIFRRREHYCSDWIDGLHEKLLPAATFLYFAILLPSISFGALNESNTNGYFSVKKTIVSQAIGGLAFSLFSTQPLVVLMSTAPLAIFIKLAFAISVSENIPFAPFYAWIGIFSSIFMILSSVLDLSTFFMRYSSPFLCETFQVFISLALILNSVRALVKEFILDWAMGKTDKALLWLILLVATVKISLIFRQFRESTAFSLAIRESVSDFCLPTTVIIVSFFGSYVFRSIDLEGFNATADVEFSLPDMSADSRTFLIAAALGLALSILMFMIHSITAAIVSSPANKLKKGAYYHSDIVLVAMINLIFSLYGLPWMHGSVPHSPLHVKSIAVVEKSSKRKTIFAVESRLAVFLAHVCVGASFYMLPLPLKFIPYPVLYGLFIFLAVTALADNVFYERIINLALHLSRLPFTVEPHITANCTVRDGNPNLADVCDNSERDIPSNGYSADNAEHDGDILSNQEKGAVSIGQDNSHTPLDSESLVEFNPHVTSHLNSPASSNSSQHFLDEIEQEDESKVENYEKTVAIDINPVKRNHHNVDNKLEKEEEEQQLNENENVCGVVRGNTEETLPLIVLHRFTYFQLACLAVLCVSGLTPLPYLNVTFPVVLVIFMPFRTIVLEKYFGHYIELLDPTQSNMED